MPDSWKSDYLLNLVLVARIDNVLKPMEVLFLSKVRHSIGAENRDMADAVIRSYGDNIAVPDNLITQERLLKDMITMSIIDGVVHDKEMEIVFNYVDAARISADRVCAIIREALAGVADQTNQIRVDVDRRMLC